METYLIKNDEYKFQEFDLEIENILDFFPEKYDIIDLYDFSLINISFEKCWGNIETGFTAIDNDPKATIPDISCWIGATLILSPRAYSILNPLIHSYGEFLPVQCYGETFYIFNCLTLGKVNESQSEQRFFEGEVVGINKLIFEANDISDKPIFKTTYTNCLDVFCDENIKNTVQQNKLTGVIFNTNLIAEF